MCQFSLSLLTLKMGEYFTVRRGSDLAQYFHWAYPYRNYISESRTRECMLNDLTRALFRETQPLFRDNEFLMIRGTRFSQLFKISHIQVRNLFELIQRDLVRAEPISYDDSSSFEDDLGDVMMEEEELSQSDGSYYTDEGYDSA